VACEPELSLPDNQFVPVTVFIERGRDGWPTLNVGNPPPQRLTEYMPFVTTSVATAATAAAPVSSSHSHFSLSLVFSMLIQCGHGCLLELRTLVIFLLGRLLVAAFLICHLLSSSDDDETRRAINLRRGGQHSTVNHHRKASKATPSSLKSIAYRPSPPICCLHRLWSYTCSLSCCLIPICIYICISTDAK
jgi:hypothetical protein